MTKIKKLYIDANFSKYQVVYLIKIVVLKSLIINKYNSSNSNQDIISVLNNTSKKSTLQILFLY